MLYIIIYQSETKFVIFVSPKAKMHVIQINSVYSYSANLQQNYPLLGAIYRESKHVEFLNRT